MRVDPECPQGSPVLFLFRGSSAPSQSPEDKAKRGLSFSFVLHLVQRHIGAVINRDSSDGPGVLPLNGRSEGRARNGGPTCLLGSYTPPSRPVNHPAEPYYSPHRSAILRRPDTRGRVVILDSEGRAKGLRRPAPRNTQAYDGYSNVIDPATPSDSRVAITTHLEAHGITGHVFASEQSIRI